MHRRPLILGEDFRGATPPGSPLILGEIIVEGYSVPARALRAAGRRIDGPGAVRNSKVLRQIHSISANLDCFCEFIFEPARAGRCLRRRCARACCRRCATASACRDARRPPTCSSTTYVLWVNPSSVAGMHADRLRARLPRPPVTCPARDGVPGTE